MTQAYEERFRNAFTQSELLGLEPIEFISDSTVRASRNLDIEIFGHLHHAVGNWNNYRYAGKCVEVSLAVQIFLQSKFNIRSWMTFGYFRHKEAEFFKTPIDKLKSYLKEKPIDSEVNFHCWLTLSSLEVLDFSILASIGKVYNIPNYSHACLSGYPDEMLPDIEFHPQLIGNRFIEMAGLVKMKNYFGI